MFDKFDMIDNLIVGLDALADARGVARCTGFVKAIQQLNALKDGLQKEDDAHEAEKELLRRQLAAAQMPPTNDEDGGETIGGERYVLDVERQEVREIQ